MNLQNIGYEQVLLGNIIKYPDILDDYHIFENLFTTADNKKIYKTILGFKEHGYEIDFNPIRDKSGISYTYLSELMEIGFVDIKYYYDILFDLYNKRELIKTSYYIQSNISGDYNNLISIVEKQIQDIDSKNEYDIKSIKEAIPEVIKDIEEIYHGTKDYGVKHNTKPFGLYINGFLPAQLIILAGRPSMGKTACMLQLALNIAEKCGIISLETTKKSLTMRMLSNLSCINLKDITGATQHAFKRLTDSCDILHNREIDIYDPPIAYLSDIKKIVRRMVKNGAKIVFIDYLTLIVSDDKRKSYTEQIAEISRTLKQISRINNVPIVCLSQLTRDAENKRPTLADLRWSGDIEQDADIVILLHGTRDSNNIEIIIAKQKDGPIGSFQMRFSRDYQRISEYISD